MTEARSLMTKNLITVKATTPIIAAYEEMRDRGIRQND